MSKDLNIKVGDRFFGFHDGKWSLDRMVVVVIDDVVDRTELCRRDWKLWTDAVRTDLNSAIHGNICHYNMGSDTETRQFWDYNCTQFYLGHIDGMPETQKDSLLIAKRPYGFGWYAVNWNYEVDLEDGFRRTFLRKLRRWAKGSGQKIVFDRASGLYRYEKEEP